MPHPIVSLELTFDPVTEAAVRDEWAALAASGLSSMAAHTSPSNRPHVTLAVRPEMPEVDPSALADFLPTAATLGAPLLFGTGDRRVLARSVLPTAELLALHAAVHDLIGPGDDAPHTRPGEWTPHVTLARRLRLTDLAAALTGVGEAIPGTAVALRRWDARIRAVTHLVGEPPEPGDA